MNFSLQLVALGTILRRELNRILRIWGQTLVPPAITMPLIESRPSGKPPSVPAVS